MVTLHSQLAAIWLPPGDIGEDQERKVNNLSFKQSLLHTAPLIELWLNIALFIQQIYPVCKLPGTLLSSSPTAMGTAGSIPTPMNL